MEAIKWQVKATTNSNHKLPVAENLLNQKFNVDRPAAVWATDTNMKTELCKKALNNAVMRYGPEEARRDILWYIEAYYNRKRRHQALGYMSPYEFKQRYLQGVAA